MTLKESLPKKDSLSKKDPLFKNVAVNHSQMKGCMIDNIYIYITIEFFLDSTNKYYEESQQISKSCISELSDEAQKEAVAKALKKPFQLIQGPPGTCNNN